MGSGIDLHTHSTASDGSSTPTQVVRAAAAAGLQVLALTDHDGFGGLDEARAALPAGLTLLPGVEISCVAVEDDRRIGLHLLGYLPDPLHTGLSAALEGLRTSRDTRAQEMVRLLVAGGYPVTWEQVQRLAGGAVVGRPHVGLALVEAGSASSVQDAFTRVIGPGSPYRVPKADLPVLDAVRLVRAAGGVPVFAHPDAHRRGPTVSEGTVAAMAGAGLAGLEVDHVDHDAQSRARLRGIAADLGLFCTGSSDYHGTHKPGLELGRETTSPEVLEQILEQATGCRPVTADAA